MSSTDHSWHVIYPAYLNSNKTLAEGRRIPKSKCASDPRWQEIKDVLEVNKSFKVDAQPNKIYPREVDKEIPIARGRVLYQLADPNDKQFGKKENVLIYLGQMIPKLKSRTTKANETQVAGQAQAGGKKKKGKR